jgi:hypothetical protein
MKNNDIPEDVGTREVNRQAARSAVRATARGPAGKFLDVASRARERKIARAQGERSQGIRASAGRVAE